MKKNNIFALSGGAIIALSALIIATGIGRNIDINGYIAGDEEKDTYTLTLDENTNPLDVTEITSEVKTTQGSTIKFRHEHVDKTSGYVITLSPYSGDDNDGYLLNETRISGMTGITIDFDTTLSIEYSWENSDVMLVHEELTSGVKYNFLNGSPSYFKLVNDGNSVTNISKIVIEYTCEPVIKKVVKINYFYKDTETQIADPTYLILDENERYGEEGVSGKGRIKVDGKTYLPDLFWVAGAATENKVHNVYYTEADVYDGYNPATDGDVDPSSGSGTSEDPYIISSAKELISYEYNNRGGGATDSASANVDEHIKLAKSIDLTGYDDWRGICSGQYYIHTHTGVEYTSAGTFGYSGASFDGCGYTIAGIDATPNEEGIDFSGIGFISEVGLYGTVKNLNLEGVIEASVDEDYGSVCGNCSGNIENINSFIDATYTLSSDNSTNYIGGIVGHMPSTINMDSKVVNVNYYGELISYAGISTGGIVGYIHESNIESTQSRVRNGGLHNSTNYGTVISSSLKVGGVAGSSHYSYIGNCSNYGHVQTGDGTQYVGVISSYIEEFTYVYGGFAGGVIKPYKEESCTGGFIVGFDQNSSPVYGYTGTATESYPAVSVVNGATYLNQKLPNGEFADVVYPSKGQFKVIGENDWSTNKPIYI